MAFHSTLHAPLFAFTWSLILIAFRFRLCLILLNNHKLIELAFSTVFIAGTPKIVAKPKPQPKPKPKPKPQPQTQAQEFYPSWNRLIYYSAPAATFGFWESANNCNLPLPLHFACFLLAKFDVFVLLVLSLAVGHGP